MGDNNICYTVYVTDVNLSVQYTSAKQLAVLMSN